MYTDNEILFGRARLGDELLRRPQDRCCRAQEGSSCPSCEDNSSAHSRESWGLVGHPLAMVYSPIQSFTSLYELDDGFEHGTIFSELNLPFLGYNVKGGGCCGQ